MLKTGLWQLCLSLDLSTSTSTSTSFSKKNKIKIKEYQQKSNNIFFRATNAIFGKIGRVASEEVVLELVKYKCLPILLYSLECCPLNKSDVKSLDFAVTRFLMKLFKSVNLDLLTNVGSVSTFRSLANCQKKIAIIPKKIRRHWPHNTIFWQKFSQFAQYM